MFISLYNKLCKTKEQYNILDTFILGMCFIMIPLSLSSLWLPSNHYILLVYVTTSILYWFLNKKHLKKSIEKLKKILSEFSIIQITAILLSLICILLYVLYCTCWDDALYYHHQQIQWNEEYAVIPGLANIEDRFGFNSNYLLLSSIFTFRFLFSDPLYALQSILFIYVMIWVFKEVITSNFQINRLILLFIFLFLFLQNSDFLTDSSTDIMPNVCAFYFIAYLSLYPNSFKEKKLFVFILPLVLCTFKMSIFPLCIVSIYILYYTIKFGKKTTLIFLITSSFLIIGLWLIRNVIISGYLVYPLYELDIFSFDWKVPEGIAKIQQKVAITTFARGLFKDFITFHFFERSGYFTFKLFFFKNVIVTIFYLIIVFSLFVIPYKLIKKGNIKNLDDNAQLILYTSLIVSFIYWLLSAPDVRFASGIICGATFFILNFFFGKREIYFPKLGAAMFYGTIVFMAFMSISRSNRFLKWMDEYRDVVNPYNKRSLLLEPFSANDQATQEILNSYIEYKMNNGITVYLFKDGNSYGKIPCTRDIYPNIILIEGKLQSIETVEARGSTVQRGFRTKKEYIPIIDSLAEEGIVKTIREWQ